MITDRTATEVILRLTVHEAALIALALDGYGDAIDPRATPLAAELYPSKTRRGLLTSDELDAVAQSNPTAIEERIDDAVAREERRKEGG